MDRERRVKRITMCRTIAVRMIDKRRLRWEDDM
jgi:hypothetical protein